MDELLLNLSEIYLQLLSFLNNIPFYIEEFPKIKEEYAKIIMNYQKLNEHLNLNHPLEYFALFRYMLNGGYFSYQHHLEKTMDKARFYDISFHYELDVINGYANCRHVTVLFNDILNTAHFKSGLVLVNMSSLKYKVYFLTLKLEKLLKELDSIKDEEIEDLLKQIYKLKIKIEDYEEDIKLSGDDDLDMRKRLYNHIINTINYQGQTYFIDATNGHLCFYNGACLETFYDKRMPIILYADEYQKYRNNQKPKVLKEWLNSSTTSKNLNESEDIIKKGEAKFFSHQDLLEDFYKENAESYTRIVRKLERYKK